VTVCVAALADDSKAIVCVGDKAISYGDYATSDVDSSKLVELSGGALVLVAGEEACTSRLLHSLASEDSIGHDIAATARLLERKHKECLWDLIEINFLSPSMLTRQEYATAICGTDINEHIQALASAIGRYNMNCELLMCGFDAKATSYLLHLTVDGSVTDMTRTGFHAIGSGSSHAISRLLFSESKRTHPIDRVLYDSFDAKVGAELAVGVGYSWDGKVIVRRSDSTRTNTVPDKIREIVERAWAEYNTSPFEEIEPDDLPPPPKNWKYQLKRYASSLKEASG
jgi:hypothetical protein